MTSQEKQDRLKHLKAQASNARQLQFVASEMRDAAGVFRIERELRGLYQEIDQLLAI